MTRHLLAHKNGNQAALRTFFLHSTKHTYIFSGVSINLGVKYVSQPDLFADILHYMQEPFSAAFAFAGKQKQKKKKNETSEWGYFQQDWAAEPGLDRKIMLAKFRLIFGSRWPLSSFVRQCLLLPIFPIIIIVRNFILNQKEGVLKPKFWEIWFHNLM